MNLKNTEYFITIAVFIGLMGFYGWIALNGY